MSIRETTATRSPIALDTLSTEHGRTASTKGEDRMGRNHRIMDWNPEDTAAWEGGNKKIARRNLLCTMAGDHVAFSIWSLWSVMALFMPAAVYGFSAGDKLLLGAIATLVGGCVRIPYTLGIAAFGGRNWTTFSAFVLLIPTVGTMVLLANPGLPLWPYVVCAALTGLGGGNYAASLANVNAFYPQRLKGATLAINAGVGNLGVAVIQLAGLLVLAAAGHEAPYWVCAVYLVLLAVVGIAAALFMDNLDHGIEVNTMRSILSSATRMPSRCSTSAPSAPGSGSPSPSARCCRSTSWPMGKPPSTRRCTPHRSPSSDRYWDRWPGSTAGSWPIEWAVAASPCAGIINGQRKSLHRGKAVAAFVLGTQRLFDYIHENPSFEFRPISYTNDPFVVAQNDRMVAINSALQIDLTGQVCADSLGTKPYSGFGGQIDFIRGAARSRGGIPIIALPSTACRGSVSRIVPVLEPGAGVVTSRADVHYVVTEHGIAYLHGKTLRERAEALIGIADPRFQQELEDFAVRAHYLERKIVAYACSGNI